MREINQIIVHCSATKPSMDIGAAEIRQWHLAKGWDDIGYNFVICRNGELEPGRDLDGDGDVLEEIGAHAAGFNAHSIGICLVGGMDEQGNDACNFTFEQYVTLHRLVEGLKGGYGIDDVRGHRDLPGVTKACPCFDVLALLENVA